MLTSQLEANSPNMATSSPVSMAAIGHVYIYTKCLSTAYIRHLYDTLTDWTPKWAVQVSLVGCSGLGSHVRAAEQENVDAFHLPRETTNVG
jgi:urease accessory protein UreH